MPPTRYEFVPHAAALAGLRLSGAAVAVIDVLRATTTVTAALAAGAREIIPAATVSEARVLVARLRGANRPVVLAGERGGVKLPGFDRGNSPREFAHDLDGVFVVLATSNGTRALSYARPAPFVIAACLNNLSAAAEALAARSESRVLIVGAGEADAWSEEDSLTAGLLLRDAVRIGRGHVRPARDFDRGARAVYALTAGLSYRGLARLVAASPHGRDLSALGFAADLTVCSRVNTTRMVGRLERGRIVKINKKA